MAEKTNAALYADAHARMDEHEKRLDKAEKGMSPEVLAGILQGAVGALFAQMKAEVEKALKAPREDPQISQLCAALAELVQVMKTPTTRESIVNLPSGPVTVTTKEGR